MVKPPFDLRISSKAVVKKKLRILVHMEFSTSNSVSNAPLTVGLCHVQEIYKDRKKFSRAVFEVASSDLVNMGISVVSYTLKDLKDDEVSR